MRRENLATNSFTKFYRKKKPGRPGGLFTLKSAVEQYHSCFLGRKGERKGQKDFAHHALFAAEKKKCRPSL